MSVGKRQLLRLGRPLRAVAATMAVVLAAGLASAAPALADPERDGRPKVADHERPVRGKDAKTRPRTPDPAARAGAAARASWPAPGKAEAKAAGGGGSARSTAGWTRAGDLPIWLGPPAVQKDGSDRRPALTGRVEVEVLSRQAAGRAGVTGLMLSLAPVEDGASGRAGVRVDYSAFAQAFGGAYGTRLRLVRLPACALTAPAKPECRTSTPVPSANDGEKQTLTADVEPAARAAGPTVLAAVAAPEGSQGDFKATKLDASATWKVTANTGDFTWSYPMRVPPVPGGLTPKVDLVYSAQSVDGRTANTNSQPSWAGEGFELSPGFIERRYKSCEDDGVPPNADGKIPGDLCWGYDNATVTWNGKGGELIKAADGTWRLRNDDGTRFERLTSPYVQNGDDDGEYWRVTTTDGTRYFFGRNRLPGWGSGGPETNSAWTVPAFGDDAKEPCHKDSGFDDSWCQQAWRWNLDMVLDPNGNSVIYLYEKETNHYARNLVHTTPYTRGGYLTGAEYGLRGDNVFAGAPPARVQFDTAERCIPDASFDCAPAKISTNPEKWWDVPWDMNCDAGTECRDGHGGPSPTFWSRKRLTKVTTSHDRGAGWGYRKVDSWSLDHQWGAVNDERDLLLKEIQHAGLAGPAGAESIALPKVTFNHVPKANRLDQANDGVPPYTRYRVGKIFDESGGEIDIAYSGVDCSRADPPAPESNTRRCYPSIWHQPGQTTPITDWFNKFVVTSVVQRDRTGGSPDMATNYAYLDGAAWHYADDDGLTREKYKTWSQWRGYGHVRVTTGGPGDPKSQTDTYYLRGMHGDRAGPAGGSKNVQVPDGEGGTHTDHEGLDGFELRTVQYTGPGGSVHGKSVSTPWRLVTATRDRSWGTVHAAAVNVGTARTWTAMGGGTWRETRTDTEYETEFLGVGRVKSVNDLADVSTAADDRCTRTEYADDKYSHKYDYPSRVETVSVACAAEPDRTKDLVSDTRTYYDGGGFGDPPTRGNVTKTERVADHDGANARYVTGTESTHDRYGRVLTSANALGQINTTRYTETAGLTTQTAVTSPRARDGDASSALTITTQLDQAWGQPIAVVDANGLRTDLARDALGRLTKVWLPDRDKASDPVPNAEFGYQITDGKIVAVTTKTVTEGDGQRPIVELYDGWLRKRQTQIAGPGGRLIADTFYDDRGLVAKEYDVHPATGAPAPVLFAADPAGVETQSHFGYDGLGRQTVERLVTGATGEKWRTTTSYGGDWTAVDPPSGGVPTAEFTDARGQVTERRQYSGPEPSGPYDATKYAWDGAGRMTGITDPSGNSWKTTYDLRGRKVKTSDPDRGAATFGYDDLDRETSATDARGKTLHTAYDGLGRKTDVREESQTGSRLISWAYDTAPRGKGMLASATRHRDDGDYTSRVTGYDVLGRGEGGTITVPSSQGALAGTYAFGQTFNPDGTLATQTLPAAGGLPAETLAVSYDAYRHPTRLTSGLGTYVNHAEYTPSGKPKLVELGASGKRVWNALTWEYGTQRLESSRTYREGVTGDPRRAAYRYDDAGNILSISDVSADGTDNQCYTYDHLRRLTGAWSEGDTACSTTPTADVIGGPAPYWRTFTYDKAGNRKTETRHGVGGKPDTNRTYAYEPPGQGNRLTKITQTGGEGDRTDTFAYDEVGNTTGRALGTTRQTLDWNSEGDLATVTQDGATTQFINGPGGDRLIRKDPGGTTLYLPGTELRAEPGATTPTATRYYTHGGENVALRTTAGGLTFLTGDHQGTAQVAIAAADLKSTVRRFTPFGTERGTPGDAWPDERGFVGGIKDPTGLTHLGARDYDPETGRFTSVDPLMKPSDPQQLNGYTYADNTPVVSSDPDGLLRDGGGQCGTIPENPCTGGRRFNPGVSKAYDKAWEKAEETRRNTYGAPAAHCYMNPMRGGCPIPDTKMGDAAVTELALQLYERAHWGFVQRTFKQKLKDMGTFSGTVLLMMVGGPEEILGSALLKGLIGLAKALRAKKLKDKANGLPKPDGPPRTQNPGCRSSFSPGTTVVMADGTRKPIQEIRPGDKVAATDPATGATRPQVVVDTVRSTGVKTLVAVTVDTDGARGGKTGVVLATGEHPFWVAGDIGRWVKAENLEPGMWLRTSAGAYVQVTALKTRVRPFQTVHNLTVANAHTYYVAVGTATVLVHNDDCLTAAARAAAADAPDDAEKVAAARLIDRGDGQPGPIVTGLSGARHGDPYYEDALTERADLGGQGFWSWDNCAEIRACNGALATALTDEAADLRNVEFATVQRSTGVSVAPCPESCLPILIGGGARYVG
ncbi:sugar-binding protein [Actinomadura sp. KC06]|uniref:polymorphic toxin-type HINT domain-containing protein n=1 Tax=Actinomadura sp. KC06 TaxID=2530369 RepID=UPI0010448D18|nr:polymorphic toxin-type HINT domain-containing protein [Actinomadura sp. KC06]TDD40505.1 sugar-binding protein [Actinomadura sp. KC06]